MRHIAQGWDGLAAPALNANAAAVSRRTEVAKNPGTRYFLPIMRSKNARCSRRKPPPLHVSPSGGVGLDVHAHTYMLASYAPGVDATEDDGCGFYLLRDIIPDHGVEHRTQFHIVNDTKLLTTGPKILSHHFNISFHRSVVFKRVLLDLYHGTHHIDIDKPFILFVRGDSLCVQAQHVLHGDEKVLLQAYSIGPSVETLVVGRGKCA